MSATNSTTHYSLPSFLGSDKPAWLVDWNGAMATIDSAIYEAKQAADTASASASAVASDLATLSGTVSSQGSTISTLSDTLTTAVGNINTINGNITTINSLIGNGTPTTTDQTLIGAINELNAGKSTVTIGYDTVSGTTDASGGLLIQSAIPSGAIPIIAQCGTEWSHIPVGLYQATNGNYYAHLINGLNGSPLATTSVANIKVYYMIIA